MTKSLRTAVLRMRCPCCWRRAGQITSTSELDLAAGRAQRGAAAEVRARGIKSGAAAGVGTSIAMRPKAPLLRLGNPNQQVVAT
jgi:hypothetical protein